MRTDGTGGGVTDAWIFLSAAYLALPLFAFAWGWLAPPAALAFSVALVALLVPIAVRARGGVAALAHEVGRAPRAAAALGGVVALAVACSGIGGFGFANLDHEKHAAILGDLVREPWPVFYAESGRPLVFYVGWYLGPALIGKGLGWTAANLALFAWSALGLALAAGWIAKLGGGLHGGAWRTALFFAISGWDVVGRLLAGASIGPGVHLEHWNGVLSYQSATTQLLWVPHQAIAAWILTGWLVDRGLARDAGRMLPAVVALGGLWTPWACLGLLPLGVWAALRERRMGDLPSWTWVPALAVAGVIAAYYLARPPDPSAGWTFAAIAERRGWVVAARIYAWIHLLEVVPLALLAGFAVLSEPRRYAALAAVAVATLAFLPLHRAGVYNDFAMRASIPALFVLAMLVIVTRGALRLWTPLRIVAVLLLLLPGLATPANEWIRGLREAGASFSVPRERTVPRLSAWHQPAQYLGRGDAFFFTVLARTPRRAPPAVSQTNAKARPISLSR